jgi:hypothetical protein
MTLKHLVSCYVAEEMYKLQTLIWKQDYYLYLSITFTRVLEAIFFRRVSIGKQRKPEYLKGNNILAADIPMQHVAIAILFQR